MARILKFLLLYGLFLFQSDIFNLMLQLNDFQWHMNIADMYACARFVHRVNGFVGKVAVRNVAVCQFDACLNRLRLIFHLMMVFVPAFYVIENLHRLFRCRRFHQYFLESAFESTVFFNILAVFVKSGGADALQLAACKSWLEHVGSVERAVGVTSANNIMNLINENDDIRIFLQLIENRLHTFLKLSSVFRSCYN